MNTMLGEFKGDKSCRVRTVDHSRSVNDDVVRNYARSAVRTLQDLPDGTDSR